jgi:hypothetical protein
MMLGAIGGMFAKKALGSIMGGLMSGRGSSKASGSSNSRGASAYEQFTQNAQANTARMQGQSELIKAHMKRMENAGNYMSHLKA